ncbi:MAG: gliding motility-associated C-terminal domain-containing protein [Bacteroidota bacterium]
MQIRTSLTFRLLRNFLLAFAALTPAAGELFASHNLAGDITYEYLGNNTVEITVSTYTDPSAALVDRCSIDLEIWNGNGSIKVADITGIPRDNGPFGQDAQFPINCPNQNMGEYIIGSVKRNTYRTTYTLPGPGIYLVRFTDLARLDNIVNMANSGSQSFFIETSIFINGLLGPQNSPQFLNHPIDDACTERRWTHNPGAFDPDGDSLNFRFVDCRQYDPPSIPSPITCTGFIQPDLYGNNGPMTIDPTTGLITWDTPQNPGIYNIAFVIEEYRNGQLIGQSFRDMAIFVYPCDNNPPVVESITDTCIYAGDTLSFEFLAYDPDFSPPEPPPGDSIYLFLNNNGANNNGPFSVASNPAQLVITEPLGQPIPPDFPIPYDDTIRGQVTWATDCSHIRPAFYQLDFYAHDNITYFGSQLLSTHKIIKIRVIPRPVTGLTAVASNREITLNWDLHPCDSIREYQIFRRIGGGGYTEDPVCCDGDPEAQGYTLVGTNPGRNNTTFVDDNNGDNFEFGQDICYIVRAVMVSGVVSCASNEVCVMIDNDFPVLLQDSIDVTSPSGQIWVSWSQPDIDPIFPGPYTYELLRANEISGALNWQTVATNLPFNDTTFLDNGMDTEVRGYRYRADVYDATGTLVGEGNVGSSIYLTISPGDQQLNLEWREFVPWLNRIYYIYRADDFTGPLTLIDSVPGTGATRHTYTDTGLENFEDYCYVIVSEGEYASPEVPDSVRNASQRACGTPQDLEPPCIGTVVFDTTRDCRNLSITFNWTDPDSSCGADVDFWTIYRADKPDEPFTQVTVVDSGVNFVALPNLTTIADCYGVTATDTNGNESEMKVFCFENCPTIELSNVFTPNNDGVNDFFAPIRDRNVTITLVEIYDRWGSKVYTSNSVPEIRQIWDGRNNEGQNVPEGVYYYYVRYEEDRLPDMVPKPPLVGHVTLMR